MIHSDENSLDDLKDVIDIHVHTSPDLQRRFLDSYEAAEQAKNAGMRGIVLKSHDVPTTDRTYFVRKFIKGIEVFGGITLNYTVGGFNPKAVKFAIESGAKIVWMPTFDASNHLRAQRKSEEAGLSLTSRGLEGGELLPKVKEICDLIAEADVALASGHISANEIINLMDYARSVGVKKIVINHPNFIVPNLTIEQQKQMAQRGATLEHCFSVCMPVITFYQTTGSVDPLRICEAIRSVGPEHCVLATDFGQYCNFSPVDGMRVFIRMMLEYKLSKQDIDQMVKTNPAILLNLET